MRNSLKRRIGGEEGKVLVLVLAMLVIGGLVLAPLLGLGSTGLAAGRVYERKAAELYAADAGVEDGIWKLQNPDVSGLQHGGCAETKWSHSYPKKDEPLFELNGKSIVVTIDYLGDGLFRITSTASENGSSTTVLSYVQADYVEGYDTVVENGGTYEGTVKNETVYGEGDLHITENLEEGAVVFVVGALTVGGNIEGDAQVYVMGDLTMSGFSNIEGTAIVCVGGDLTIGHCSEDGVEVYVLGNLYGQGEGNGIENSARVCVEKNITVSKIENYPTVCSGEVLTVANNEGGYLYAEGYEYPFSECPMCCAECEICCVCPLQLEATGGWGYWSDWKVTTYLINP